MPTILKKNTRRGQSEERVSTERALQRFQRNRSWFIMEMQRQAANRYQMALDEDYYDGDQWTPSEAAAVRARGQNPVVMNEVKPMLDFVIGTERRLRVDAQVINRNDSSPEADQDAQNKSQLIKFVDDVNRVQFLRSDAADDQFKAGLGWLEQGIRSDPSKLPIYLRHESWRNMLYDSLGKSKMPDDWRYMYRFREVDFDIAEALTPRNKVDQLRRAVIHPDKAQHLLNFMDGAPMSGMMSLTDLALTGRWTTYDAEAWLANPRERVLLIEAWMTEVFRDEGDSGGSIEDQPIRMRKRVSIMTEYDTLIESWSPFNHDMFPFIPLWCYRRKKDGAPYGLIRQHRGAQDSLNKFMSKAQFRLATRQVWMEEGALDEEVMDEDQFEDAVGDPSAIITVAKGALSGNRIEVKEGTQLAAADIQMADRFAQGIRQLGPVSTEDRGQDPSDVSGKARAIRQEQGSRLTAEVFDNQLLARQIEGEMKLSLIEQYQIEPFEFRVPGDGGGQAQYVKINQPDPSNPGRKLNDITARKAHFVIGETPWQQSLAEAMFESLMGMMGELAKVAPQVVVGILDVVFEMNPSLPKKQVLLARIRQVTGMPDPAKGDTPEMQQKQKQQAEMAQAQYAAQMAQLRADVLEAQAKGIKLNAEAMAKRLETLYMAAQAAQVLTMAPQIAPVADELARSVGFKDEHGDPALGGPVDTVSAPAVPPAVQADGALAGHEQGIESPAITGVEGEATNG